MAGGSLLALLDDIATILDDVAVMTKVAAKKTAGVLGDDLALNAQQVTGVLSERELPVVWAVAKGSMVNKAILVPAALVISAFVPMLITPLLMLGGAFLCFEGFEKVLHKFLHREETAEEATEHARMLEALADPQVDMATFERDKIKGAVRTDFILSAEIIVIALGTMGGVDLLRQTAALVALSLGMTVGVYGLVAGIVKLDDAGVWLLARPEAARQALGRMILRAAPVLMKSLGVLGTAAMFLVGGQIVAHGIPPIHHVILDLAGSGGGVAGTLISTALDGVVGILTGAVVLAVVSAVSAVYRKARPAA